MSQQQWQSQVGDREEYEATCCVSHPARPGVVHHVLPSIGVDHWLCGECADTMQKAMNAAGSNDPGWSNWKGRESPHYDDREFEITFPKEHK